ncbi:hydroxysteroid 11-beta-dehydrogenase 1-like protein isoform X2 [Branchiostoma lanceolatum]|uniref:hydroxysteroid 11-beta-dehydrogenase 1-like protein isoform X2 n=1 Tax=Branchiostoma lanceolatum TaxID=7740 RepID=UPI00345737B6
MSRLAWGGLGVLFATVGFGVYWSTMQMMSWLVWGSIGVLLGAVGLGVYWSRDGFDPESIRGATVVITGCSTGIGEEMAYQYARLGAKILITARRENRLKEVVAKAKSLGAQEAHYVAGDMGKAEDCERTIQTAKEKFGRLDYLVLNHAGSSLGSVDERAAKLQTWDQDLDMDFYADFVNINLISYVRLASLALPLLKESNGHIVVMGSLGGKLPGPYFTYMSTAKFGLDGFFSSLRLDMVKARQNVSVSYVVTGFVRTAGVEEMVLKMPGGEKMLEAAAPVNETAYTIIRGGATRTREIHAPSYTWLISKIRMFPGWLEDYLILNLFSP